MRKTWAKCLEAKMAENENIYLLTADLGYGLLDDLLKKFPDRVLNVGASEQAAVGIAVGLALSGKIPFVYSITNFVLYRPFEFIRNYLASEGIPVHLVGSGRDKDYAHDGISHWSEDAKDVLEALNKVSRQDKGIKSYFPQEKEEMSAILDEIITLDQPSFTSLRR